MGFLRLSCNIWLFFATSGYIYVVSIYGVICLKKSFVKQDISLIFMQWNIFLVFIFRQNRDQNWNSLPAERKPTSLYGNRRKCLGRPTTLVDISSSVVKYFREMRLLPDDIHTYMSSVSIKLQTSRHLDIKVQYQNVFLSYYESKHEEILGLQRPWWKNGSIFVNTVR